MRSAAPNRQERSFLMNARLALSIALFAGSLALGLIGGPVGPAAAKAQPSACWSGYHLDSMGSCQSDNPVLDTRCGPGLTTQVFPNANGYICVPIPKGY
jgi:hypothetical protein